MVEVQGLSMAVVAANLATQAASVTLGGFGYLHEGQVMVTIRGSVDSVRAALDAISGGLPGAAVHASGVIARPDPQVERVIGERFVPVGGRVGAPRVPGRGRRYNPPAPDPGQGPGQGPDEG
jgi:microcompartment protein CcmL/EutN